MRRLGTILAWSAISAAFIGPGTVTTAGIAGASFGHQLLWVLAASTAVCLVLQEAVARLGAVSGGGLGQALATMLGAGAARAAALAVILGCAAFQAGNLLGAAAGLALATNTPAMPLAVLCGALAGLLVAARHPERAARGLAVFVALMGISFAVAAFLLAPPLGSVLRGALVPSVPEGSGALVLGLFGTTVVPYNLFLGASLARGQTLGDARLGLAVSIVLGGLVSMTIVVVGSAVAGDFTFGGLAGALSGRIGPGGGLLLATGLAAAGLSSAITAPLAAGIAWRDVGGPTGARVVPLVVLGVGIAFGLIGAAPVPVIVAAQAVNGLLLPFVALLLLLAVNDRRIMGGALPALRANLLLACGVAGALAIGAAGLANAVARVMGREAPAPLLVLGVALLAALLLGGPLVRGIARRRAATPGAHP